MLDPHDQLAVLRGLRDGSRDAWTTLYDNYSADVWRYVARLLGSDKTAVADVTQETFLAAAKTARQFDPERGSCWGWLAGIAHHQAAQYWRQAARQARLKKLAEAGAAEIREWLDRTQRLNGSPLEEPWERFELADLVRAVLAELPPDYAALLTAKYLNDQSLEQMTREFGGTNDSLKSKLARARKEFRVKFELLTREPTPSVPGA